MMPHDSLLLLLLTRLRISIQLNQLLRRLPQFLPQTLRFQNLRPSSPLQHPPTDFAGFTDLDFKQKTAVLFFC